MTDTQPLIFYDRSRVSLDWKCPRARFWGNEFEGLGIVPARRALYFDVGDVLHKGFASLVMGEDLEETCHDVVEGFRGQVGTSLGERLEEQCCLVEGILRGFARQVLPQLLREFNPLMVETEFTHDHDGCRQGVKPDLLAERILDGTLWYWEWKSTSSVGERWALQWPKAIQLHTTAWATGRYLGREVDGVMVQGAYKGYDKGGAQTSIFCYGYQRPGNIGGPEVNYKWSNGARRVPVWEMAGGVRGWVERMPDEILSEQFVQTPPIFLQRRLVESFLKQTALREREIAEASASLREIATADYAREDVRGWQMAAVLDKVFPQHFNECTPAIGAPCAYGDCCFNPHVAADPIGSGLYVWRQPHHSTDQKGLARLAELEGGMRI